MDKQVLMLRLSDVLAAVIAFFSMVISFVKFVQL